MSDLGYLIKALATLSWRYNTFRGRWTDMPDSTTLCALLGVVSFAVSTLAIYVEYGFQEAIAIPVVWLSSIWLLASEDGAMRINKRLMSAVFLLSIPAMSLLVLLLVATGSGQMFIEVIVGVYLSAAILTLRTRE